MVAVGARPRHVLTVSPPPKTWSKNRVCRQTRHCKHKLLSRSEGLSLLTGFTVSSAGDQTTLLCGDALAFLRIEI